MPTKKKVAKRVVPPTPDRDILFRLDQALARSGGDATTLEITPAMKKDIDRLVKDAKHEHLVKATRGVTYHGIPLKVVK